MSTSCTYNPGSLSLALLTGLHRTAAASKPCRWKTGRESNADAAASAASQHASTGQSFTLEGSAEPLWKHPVIYERSLKPERSVKVTTETGLTNLFCGMNAPFKRNELKNKKFCLIHLFMSSCSSSEKGNNHEMRASQATLEQMQLFNRDRSVEILDDETPPLVVNHNKLKVSECVCVNE